MIRKYSSLQNTFTITLPGKYGREEVTVYKNPSPEDYQQIRQDYLSNNPVLPPGTPITRFTYDEQGNKYIWPADRIHYFVEEALFRQHGIKTDQNADKWEIPEGKFVSASVTESPFTLPSRKEYKENIDSFRERLKEALKARRKLIVEKLGSTGGLIPATDPLDFYIVSPEISDKSKWRVTYFKIENGEKVPVGHTVCDSLVRTDGKTAIEECLSNVDWDRWAKE